MILINKMQYENLGKYIRQKREKIEISLNEFAITNDIDPAILSRIETLKQNIKLNVLEQTPAEFLTEFENEGK